MERIQPNITKKESSVPVVEIAKAEIVDVNQLATLYQKTYRGIPPWYELATKESAASQLEDYAKENGFVVYNAFIGKEQVGALIATDSRNEDKGKERFIQELMIEPSFQGKGIGKRLLRRLIEDSSQENYQAISLQTDIRNLPAVALYKKMGFQEAYESQKLKRPTARSFFYPINSSGDEYREEVPSLPPTFFGESIFYKDELERKLLLDWNSDESIKMSPYRDLLQQVRVLAKNKGIAQELYFDPVGNTWTDIKTDSGSIILLDDQAQEILGKVSSFLLTSKKLSLERTFMQKLFTANSEELTKLISLCFDSVTTDKRINFVSFSCASYARDFSEVLPTIDTNRLLFFKSTIEEFSRAAAKLSGQAKISFLFADTDDDIYPLPKTPETRINYQKQFLLLQDYIQNLGLENVRILPWSRYRSSQKIVFDANFSAAQNLARNITEADYAAQAALLPQNTIMLILEPPKFNSYYDKLLTSEQRIPKLHIFDVDAYSQWVKGV